MLNCFLMFECKSLVNLNCLVMNFFFICRAKSVPTPALRMPWHFLRTLLLLRDVTRESLRMDGKVVASSILITAVRKMNMSLPVLYPVLVASPLSLGVLTSRNAYFMMCNYIKMFDRWCIVLVAQLYFDKDIDTGDVFY